MFSRSYCYAVWSAIGIMMSSVCGLWVCLSVRLSVCNAVHCGSQGPLHRRCVLLLASNFLFTSSETFAV